MSVALRSGWYRIEPCLWESDTGVCPFVAAAKISGFWRDGHAADGGPLWGDEESPTTAVFEFAISFDLYAKVAGTGAAVQLVLEELTLRSLPEGLPGFDCLRHSA